MKPTTVLTIAGSDSGGGAGIQADIKTISALGCYAASAITAITVQNTLGVTDVHPVPPHIIRGQICAVLDDIGADAIKIGMLGAEEAVQAVCEALSNRNLQHVVLDPVMVSTSGHRLTEESAVRALRSELIPLATIITPNIPEAEVLLDGRTLQAQADLPCAVRLLAEKYGVSVLLKAAAGGEVWRLCSAQSWTPLRGPARRLSLRCCNRRNHRTAFAENPYAQHTRNRVYAFFSTRSSTG